MKLRKTANELEDAILSVVREASYGTLKSWKKKFGKLCLWQVINKMCFNTIKSVYQKGFRAGLNLDRNKTQPLKGNLVHWGIVISDDFCSYKYDFQASEKFSIEGLANFIGGKLQEKDLGFKTTTIPTQVTIKEV